MRPIILACLATLLALPNATLRVSAQTQSQLEVTAIRRDRPVPLVEALTILGLHLKGGFVSFGVDVYGETDPEVDVNMPDTNLGDALRRITSQTPGYTSEFVSEHVVEIYSTQERLRGDDPLNLPIREFSVKGMPAFMILSLPTKYLPELKEHLSKDRGEHSELGCGSLGPGLGSYALGITLALTGRTVHEIFDAVAEADALLPVIPDSPHSSPPSFRMPPSGWVHRRKNDPKLGIVDTWSSATFVPHDWKLYVAKP